MIRRIILACLFLAGSAAQADPGVFVGVTFDFSGKSSGLGVSLKALSTRKEDKAAVAAGVTYYPLASENNLGVDLSAAYVFKNGAVTAGWDLVNNKPQAGIGYVNTKDDDDDKKRPTQMQPPNLNLSDKRLKTDIVYLATLDNGLRLYAFKYLWSNQVYVGVMAQDLLRDPAHSDKVVLIPGNYYAVDYDALGLKMITLDEWRRSHDNIHI
jgi:hypothetical protein